jgi:copper chaperone CopZ
MAVIALHVPGMTCRHRIRIVTARLRDMPGVIMVAADAVAAQVVVHGEVSEVQVHAVPHGRARFLRNYGAFDLAIKLAPFTG